jgi:hypothetical protein
VTTVKTRGYPGKNSLPDLIGIGVALPDRRALTLRARDRGKRERKGSA